MLLELAKYYLSLHYWPAASMAAIKKMQLKKFRRLFEHARQNSKFYREFYGDHGLMDLTIASPADIAKVPLTSKAVFRKHSLRDIMTCDVNDRIRVHRTSGSSAEPCEIAFDKFEDYSAHVRLLKALMEKGYSPFKKIVLLSRYETGHEFAIETDIDEIPWLRKRLGLFRRELISIFDPVESIIEKLQRAKPFVVWTTPSIIEIVALELKKSGRRLNIPLVLFMAETMTPGLVQLFKERIGENFIDLYGCMEAPSMGYGINQTGSKKIFANSVLLEVLNERTLAGEKVGDVVVTNLINHSMPIIRYNLADYVECLTDEGFPEKKLGRIYGRSEDLIVLEDHPAIAFHHTYQLFHDFQECEQYKLLQKSSGELVLQLRVIASCDKAEVKKKALARWRNKYPDLPLTVEWVDRFPLDGNTGKFKVVEKMGL
jgi:phenylacetate-CoA ligase